MGEIADKLNVSKSTNFECQNFCYRVAKQPAAKLQ